jgi:hypothetical protein
MKDPWEIEHEDLDRIESKILIEAIERSGLSYTDVASNLGWIHSKTGNADASRIRRVLGLRSDSGPDKRVSYDIAVQIVEACHFDPVDYGL